MPLVILCGPPKCGKSAFAGRLGAHLEQQGMKVVVVREEDLGDEKKSRAALLAGTERSVRKDVVVIADGTNYIKGFRYQLYCLARAQSTPHAVVYFVCEAEWDCMEEPNAQNRWDSPLFLMNQEVTEAEVFGDILSALRAEVVKKPSLATQIPEKITALTPEYLAGMERECQQVLQSLYPQLDQKVMLVDGTRIGRQYTLKELQGAQRQFMHLVKAHPVPLPQIRALFVEYLNKN